MHWSLVATLSLFGLGMGVLTVFVIPPPIEPFCWLGIFAVCAAILARRSDRGHFVLGLLVGLANSVWITAAHVAFFETYLAGHPGEARMVAGMSSPRLMMVLRGPVIGAASGVVLGLLAWGASKRIRPPAAT